MGILFESDYKSVLREGTPGGVAARLLGGRSALGGNPLKKRPTAGSQSGQAWSYESMNRDSGTSACFALLAFDCKENTILTASVLFLLFSSVCAPGVACCEDFGCIRNGRIEDIASDTLRLRLGRRHLQTLCALAIHLDEA
jgi:hypothetical protein